MIFEFDENKRKTNIAKRGLDFLIAEDILTAGSIKIIPDTREDCGEDRFNAFTELKGVRLCMCYTMRDDVYRIISLRKVHEREWRKIWR